MTKKREATALGGLICLWVLLVTAFAPTALAEIPDYSEYRHEQPADSAGPFLLDAVASFAEASRLKMRRVWKADGPMMMLHACTALTRWRDAALSFVDCLLGQHGFDHLQQAGLVMWPSVLSIIMRRGCFEPCRSRRPGSRRAPEDEVHYQVHAEQGHA